LSGDPRGFVTAIYGGVAELLRDRAGFTALGQGLGKVRVCVSEIG
jgi:hypothetical protein